MLENKEYYELLQEIKNLKETGLEQNNVLEVLKLKDISVMDAIKIISDLYTNSLVKAKAVIYESETWKERVESYEDFHAKLFASIEELETKD